jgi:hypothetical protein
MLIRWECMRSCGCCVGGFYILGGADHQPAQGLKYLATSITPHETKSRERLVLYAIDQHIGLIET